MVTMEASSTTISWAMATTTRMDQRLGSGPTSAGLSGTVSLTKELQSAAPTDHLVKHRAQRALLLGDSRLKHREILEVHHEGERHLRANGRDGQFSHDEAEVLNGPDPACATIAHEPGHFVIPLAVQEVDRIL